MPKVAKQRLRTMEKKSELRSAILEKRSECPPLPKIFFLLNYIFSLSTCTLFLKYIQEPTFIREDPTGFEPVLTMCPVLAAIKGGYAIYICTRAIDFYFCKGTLACEYRTLFCHGQAGKYPIQINPPKYFSILVSYSWSDWQQKFSLQLPDNLMLQSQNHRCPLLS